MVPRGKWIAIILAIFVAAILGVGAQLSVRAHPFDHGQTAPKFSLPSQDGSQVTLAQFKGKWLVIYCYSNRNLHRYLPDYLLQAPSGDATSANIVETQNFQRDLPQYEALNAAVVGLSPDSTEENKAFASKQAVTFPLLAVDEFTWDEYGVPFAGRGENRAVERVAFLISPSGFIVRVWFISDVQSISKNVLTTIVAAQQPGYLSDSLHESPV